jgi:DNA invertase Pin-like site-specific DNA recombinase
MKPVFGYCRVSGHSQLDGDGFPRQQEVIETYCARKGFRVVRWFMEKAVSGEAHTADRPAYVEMLSLAGPATAQTVIVERADRLARNLAVCELACEEARDSGVQILEAASDTDLTNSDDPTRVLIRQVLGALAEWNKNSLVKRLRAARERIRAEKGRCGGPHPCTTPSGGRHLVRTICDFRDNWGFSYAEIARELTKRGFKPTQGSPVWHRSTVQYLYAREKELREDGYKPFKSEKPKQHPKGGCPELLAGLPVSEL